MTAKRRKPLSPQQVQAIIASFTQHRASAPVAERCGVSRWRVMQVVNKHAPELVPRKPRPHLSVSDEQAIVTEYSKTLAAHPIAERRGITKRHVLDVVRKYTPELITRGLRPRVSGSDRNEMLHMYHKLKSCRKVAAYFGVSHQTVMDTVRRASLVPRRPRSLPREVHEEVERRLLANEPVRDIAQAVGVSVQTVRVAARRLRE